MSGRIRIKTLKVISLSIQYLAGGKWSLKITFCLGLVHWDDPEGWDGEGGGRGFRMGSHVHPWRFMLVYGKNHYIL